MDHAFCIQMASIWNPWATAWRFLYFKGDEKMNHIFFFEKWLIRLVPEIEPLTFRFLDLGWCALYCAKRILKSIKTNFSFFAGSFSHFSQCKRILSRCTGTKFERANTFRPENTHWDTEKMDSTFSRRSLSSSTEKRKQMVYISFS